MTKIREALSSKKYDLINSWACAELSCKGLYKEFSWWIFTKNWCFVDKQD